MRTSETSLEVTTDGAFLRIPMDLAEIERGWSAFEGLHTALLERHVWPEELSHAYTEENYGHVIAVFKVSRTAWRGAVPPRVGSIPPYTDAELERLAEEGRSLAPRNVLGWSPERYTEILRAARKEPEPDWPERDPAPEATSRDPRPADAPAEPRAVKTLEGEARMAGFEVRIGYSRGQARAVKKGTYKRVEAFGVWGRHPNGWRFSAISTNSPDLKGSWKWDSVALWKPGELVAPGLGTRFVDASVTDLREWLIMRTNVGAPWFKGIHAREREKTERSRAAAKARPVKKAHKEGMA